MLAGVGYNHMTSENQNGNVMFFRSELLDKH